MRSPSAPSSLSPLVQRLFRTTPGAGAPPAGATGWRHGRAGRLSAEACVEVWLRPGEDGGLRELRYRVWGCPHTIATLGWLAERWPGGAIDTPPAGGPLGWQAALDVPTEKLGRLLVIEDALRAAGVGPPGA